MKISNAITMPLSEVNDFLKYKNKKLEMAYNNIFLILGRQ